MSNNNKVMVGRYQLVDILVDGNFAGNSINIPDQPMLRDKRMKTLQIYSNSDFPNSPVTGNPLPSIAQIQQMAFVGYSYDPDNEKDSGEFLYRIPGVVLHNQQNSANEPFQQAIYEFDDLKLQWEKAQLLFTPAWTPVGSPISFVIGVTYTSRTERMITMLGKKVSGLTDGSLADMIMMKMKFFEDKIRDLENRLMGRK